MKLIIHDLDHDTFSRVISPATEDRVVQATSGERHCIGCFECWTKHPGECIFQDRYHCLPAIMGHVEEILIISRLWYGSYSPEVKLLMDRSIGVVQPDFVEREGRMHHKLRYTNQPKLTVWFYDDQGDIEEQILARDLVRRNMLNFTTAEWSANFVGSAQELAGVL